MIASRYKAVTYKDLLESKENKLVQTSAQVKRFEDLTEEEMQIQQR